MRLFLLLAALAGARSLTFAQFANDDILPPALPWEGKTKALALPADHEWATFFERSGLKATPSYAATAAWLKKLAAAAPEINLVSLGKSPEGRDIWMAVVSKEGAVDPAALKASGKPLFFAHAGIHSGEIDGKDAGLMLMRDMTVLGKKAGLLDKVNWLFTPILSVDGHERSSPHNRMNQRGPKAMGWRTNARNLNLNRDYVKLETPEVRHLIRAINAYEPDLYFDLHVTDGMDHQYDITYGFTGPHGSSPHAAKWLAETLRPAVDGALRAAGHTPGPFTFAVDRTDVSKGVVEWTAGPRFSNGYGDTRHLPTVLVENHSLKSYDRRVLGTYVLLEATMAALGDSARALRDAVAKDRDRRPDEVVLSYGPSTDPPAMVDFLAVAHEKVRSEVTGQEYLSWLGKPETLKLPYVVISQPTATVSRPKGYWIPSTWPEVIEKLALHGVSMTPIDAPREVDVEMYRIAEAKLAGSAYEGRVRVSGKPVAERRRQRFPTGSVYVTTDQPLCELIVLMLEPASPDSLFQWGYFHEILQRAEYFEVYAMEPLAKKMLASDPALRAEFDQKKASDPAFAGNPRAMLDWIYVRSPYADERLALYPIGREVD